ncbi:hypothetical protein ACG0Z4_14475 [Enterocloster aldenensis]|uniref:hypothetical protein n=1 Tax=Enterocloster aldenensis TaxID=358742 RepID=UPI004029FDDE
MYVLDNKKAICKEQHEVDVPLYERIYNLVTLKAMQYLNVVFITEVVHHADQRYRVDNMLEALENSQIWNGNVFLYCELKLLLPYIKNIDLVIINRLKNHPDIRTYIDLFHKENIQVIYGVDDLVFSKKYFQEMAVAVNRQNDSKLLMEIKQTHLVAELCDGYFVTNHYLKSIIEKEYGKPGYVLRNFLNRNQYRISKYYLEQKQRKENYCDYFMLGYFSGSPTHQKDFALISNWLDIFFSQYRNTFLKIVGYMELPDELKRFEEEGRIIRKGYMDYCSLQREIAEIDVNLIPLVENEFTNCKSELKYFEAAIVGTVSCISPTYIYKEVISDGSNGFLCNGDEWLNRLIALYEMRDSLSKKMIMLHNRAYRMYGSMFLGEEIELLFEQMRTIK